MEKGRAVDAVVASADLLGEGPVWLESESRLYWVDIVSRVIHRYAPQTGIHDRFRVSSQVTALSKRRLGGWLVAMCSSFATWSGDDEVLRPFSVPITLTHGVRFNDGAADSVGRFWIGTVSAQDAAAPVGSLFRLDPDHRCQLVDSGFACANGIGWSPDNGTMYVTDTFHSIIYAYDFDASAGNLSNKRPLIRVPERNGYPDGLAVDSGGHIWSACWGGGAVLRFSAEGLLQDQISLPVKHITSCAFGGSELNEMYITTARPGTLRSNPAVSPHSGNLFRCHVGYHGMEPFSFAG